MDWISKFVTSLQPVSLIFALSILIVTIYYYRKTRNLPPGPIGLPYFGYWPFLNEKNLYAQLNELQRKYGDFYSFTSTGRLFIFLGSFKVAQEAHVTKSDCFVGRFEDYNLLTAVFSDGFTFNNGEGWKVLRKFFLHSFKKRGLLTVNNKASGIMHTCIDSTIQELRAKTGEPVDILPLLIDKCNKILRLTLFGENGVSEKQIVDINQHFGVIMQCFTSTNLLLTGNIARYCIFPWISGYHEFKKSHTSIQKLIYKLIDEHKKTFNEDNIRDIIDEYIKERNERQSKGDPTVQNFTDKALMSTLIQIMGDGVLSVAAFIALFFKILLDNPEEQDKIFEEIGEVVGPDRQLTLEDRSRMKYTNAFMLEAMRTSVFFPFYPSLECNKATNIRGYRIPTGTITVINTWSTHNDPKVYKEPERFNPSRFLEASGSMKPELPIMFGVGKRACVAEHFALHQVFLFLTTMIKNFHIRPLKNSEGKNEPSFTGDLQIMIEPRN